MIKNQYLDELELPFTQKRNGENNDNKTVRNIQSWLALYAMSNPKAGTATLIDGIFGPATELAVENYQEAIDTYRTGKVSGDLYQKLTSPLQFAFDTPASGEDLRDKLLSVAYSHLVQSQRELNIGRESNKGPWVRSYMNGMDGEFHYWCMGFVQTIIDQALFDFNRTIEEFMPLTELCDHLGEFAEEEDHLILNEDWHTNSKLVSNGDIFLVRSDSAGKRWKHTGLIIKQSDEVIQTIEGNTNHIGGSNGDGVYCRVRNFHNTKMDVISLNYIERKLKDLD